ncbi:hypothetical protein KO02_12485 [Sphingobacterium sp. ML3W]|uniref:hypothetical protein n=1 Tax=Sphingobacterium sp. ML3W TaxID=1538644 RepID=UPI0004F72B8E|nr:hypothetical protein [Sphingobacterium sp. ML3W]AIM37415.1 hypothetical protein KO02_12485 [Sphingobacterium sp. ML3W]
MKTHDYLLTSLVEDALNDILNLATPFEYSSGEMIMVGDVVMLKGVLDGDNFEEYGVIDFIKGCLVIAMPEFEADSIDDLMILNDYYKDLSKIEGKLAKDVIGNYLLGR